MRRRGFTLLEVMLATALAAVLMAVLCWSLVSIEDSRRTMAEKDDTIRDYAMLVELLEHDLARARSARMLSDGFRLDGVGGLAPKTLEPVHRPVRVDYRVPGSGKYAGWLLREQVFVDRSSDPDAHTETLLADTRSIEAVGIGTGAEQEPVPVPPQLDIVLTRRDGSRTRLEVTAWVE